MRIRERVARRLRYTADRIDRYHAPKATSYSFTFEKGQGVRLRNDGRGCPLWYLTDADYDRAHDEADTPSPRVNWETMTVSYPESAGSA